MHPERSYLERQGDTDHGYHILKERRVSGCKTCVDKQKKKKGHDKCFNQSRGNFEKCTRFFFLEGGGCKCLTLI